jgi:hypothetical protein
MVRVTMVCVVTLMFVSLAGTPARAAERDELGRSVKLTILVDKVMQPEAGWKTEEWMIEEAAEAGFNVFSPRRGYDDLEAVRQVTEWCAKYGIYHMPWMRGTLRVPDGAEAEGKKLVWEGGNEQELWSPNSDEFWDWTNRYIIEYAKMSAENQQLMGVFLDYENYSPGGSGNCYSLSYDDLILGKFAQAKGIELPALTLGGRKRWLEQQELHEEFSEFQINHWRERCRALREAVDEHDPKFQLCIYPAPGTMFMLEACYPEWATEQAPLILADACTYGRSGGFLAHADALEANLKRLSERQETAKAMGGPFIYTGGIDPAVRGADAEFSGKNAVMISEVTDGYWIFYEGPKYQEDHADYFKWFAWANEAIAQGRFAAQHERRETPDTLGLTELVPEHPEKIQVVVCDSRPRIREMLAEDERYEVHEMEGNALSYLCGADVLILQNFNEPLGRDHPFVRTLRDYVAQGGGLFLVHDTIHFMASPFPEVAVRATPTKKVEAGYHVVETDLMTHIAHPALGEIAARTRFSTEFRDHMIFEPGAEGEVIIRNIFRDPVYVAGEVGEGRVVFSGCYYGYKRTLEGTEREVFDAIVEWLAGQ